jgi:hypothetical protein
MTGWKPVFRYPRAQDYRDAIQVMPMKNTRGVCMSAIKTKWRLTQTPFSNSYG